VNSSAVLHARDLVEDLAGRYTIRELSFDPWRSSELARELQERGTRVSAFPQTDVRIIPVFRVCEVGGPSADPEPSPRGGTTPPVRSHELLESFVAASPFDYDSAVRCRPYDRPGDQGLTGKRAEPIPDGCFERVAERGGEPIQLAPGLVASGPSLDVDQLVAIESTQHDPVGAPAAAGWAAERDRGNRRAARLELLPD
jgi:hypothetical protein